MIQKNKDEVIKELKASIKKTKYIFWALMFAVIISLGLSFAQLLNITFGVIISLYFLCMSIFILPKINRYNFDINKIENGETLSYEGDLLAVYPSEDTLSGKEWTLLLNIGEKEYVELTVDSKVGTALGEGDIISVNLTPFNQIIMDLSLIRKISN